jgi:hypothetical protein
MPKISRTLAIRRPLTRLSNGVDMVCPGCIVFLPRFAADIAGAW